ncbi:MAG: family 43 glycosylhydrolase [Bacteroidales bacterium]|nr:family 43 glycosylhydrolase [Bacteroidales bacterium]
MKRFILSLVGILCLFSTLFAQNPIIKGQYTADPTARVFGDKVWLFCSHDIISPVEPERRWFCMEDYHTFSSEDLVHWTDHGVILDQKNVPWGNPEGYSMWAPDCVEKDGKYYFYFPNASKEGRGFAVGVAIADSPEGPYVPQPEPIKGINGIDPCVLQASDGNAYIFWGNGRCAKLKPNMIELADDNPKTVRKWGNREMEMVGVDCLQGLPNRQAEGPFAFEANGWFYLTYPYVQENTEVLGYAMSKNPMGPYEYKGIIMARSVNECWTNHHSFINYKGEWYLFYHHNDYSPSFDKNRSVRIDKVRFNPDGTIEQVIPTLRGVGVTPSTDQIQMDRYNAIYHVATGIDFLDPAKPFDGWFVHLGRPDCWVRYDSVDFGEADPTSITVRYCAPKDTKFSIWFSDNDSLGSFDLPASETWKEVTLPVTGKATGLKNVKLVVNEGGLDLDWISFK